MWNVFIIECIYCLLMIYLQRRCAEKFYDEDLGLNINSYNITTFDLFEKVNSEIFQKEDGSVSYLVAEGLFYCPVEVWRQLTILFYISTKFKSSC